jgi:hypothetical protein
MPEPAGSDSAELTVRSWLKVFIVLAVIGVILSNAGIKSQSDEHQSWPIERVKDSSSGSPPLPTISGFALKLIFRNSDGPDIFRDRRPICGKVERHSSMEIIYRNWRGKRNIKSLILMRKSYKLDPVNLNSGIFLLANAVHVLVAGPDLNAYAHLAISARCGTQ